ncbi:cytochrome P450 [Trametes polyzona]|nr:cytochrome P450 [Trametes polyzona]
MFLYACLLLAACWLLRRASRSRSPLDKLPGPPSSSFVTGNIRQVLNQHGWSFHRDIARKYGPVVRLNGLFKRPLLYVFDPLALDHLLKNMGTYDEPTWYLESHKIMIGPGVLSASGETHRKQRKMLTPAFAPKHLPAFVPMFYSVVHRLVVAIDTRVSTTGTDIDMSSWMGRAALELIGQSGLGHSFDPLTEDVADAYSDAAKNFVPVGMCWEIMLLRQFVPFVKNLGPSWLGRWIIDRLPIRSLRQMIHISDTLYEGSLKLFLAKKAALEAGESADAKDIMSNLGVNDTVRANVSASDEERLPDEQIIAQTTSIILAAMDTTTNALSRILHILAEHQDAQKKLRHEILEAQAVHGNELNYDQLHALPFLDAVCRETLRLHPPLFQSYREAKRDGVLPLSQPIRASDGTLLSSLPIPRGTDILIAIKACNCNEALWGPDAYEWKPERWLAPLPATVENAGIPGIYSNIATFLGGGRSCIGFMFSQLEMSEKTIIVINPRSFVLLTNSNRMAEIVLAELLANFSFELSEKPIVWSLTGVSYPSARPNSTKPELWLKVTKLQES